MPDAPVFVRRDIWSLAPEDPIVTGYANAVKRMKEREGSLSTSWVYQAAIHGTTAKPNKPEWNECQHGTWFFLPWHRMFLWYFERIVRAAVIETGGPEDWALPYWNYGLGGERARLPEAFRAAMLAGGDANPLYIAARAEGMNSGKGAVPGNAGSPTAAVGRPAFIGTAEFGGDRTHPAQFSESEGALENTPHGSVHVVVGGKGGLMSSILTAAQDPIFWFHHANIDRLWSAWIASGEGRANPQEPEWLRQEFGFFDETGTAAALKSEQVLHTAAQLGYIYDSEAAPPPPPAPAAPRVRAVAPPPHELIGATAETVRLTGEPVTVTVPIDADAAEPFPANARVYLNVEEIQGEENPGTGYAVFAGVGPATPEAERAARRIGNLSFFGIEGARNPAGDHPPHTLRSSFEITAIAHELQDAGHWGGGELPVTFEPFTLSPVGDAKPEELEAAAHPDAPVELGRLSVFYDA